MRVLVTGSSGQLALALAETPLPFPDWHVATLGRPELDLTNAGTLKRAMGAYKPDVIVNTAAFTAVDRAESEVDAAFAVNAAGAGNLASVACDAGVPVIHISTDYVFSGRSDRPWREGDETAPVNAYGRSKLAGEVAVAAAQPRHVILRTSWVFSPWGSNFVKTMLQVGAEREQLAVVGDQLGTPTYAPDLAAAILVIAGSIARNIGGEPADAMPWGTYHLSNSGTASWHEFAEEIFRHAGRYGYNAPRLKRITTAEYPTPAERPLYSVLDNSKVRSAFGVTMRGWREGVGECVDRLLDRSRSHI